MYFKKYLYAVLAKLFDFVLPVIIGVVSFTMFPNDSSFIKSIDLYTWIYLLYGLNTIVIMIFFSGKSFGSNLLKVNYLNDNSEVQKKTMIWRELTLLVMLNLALYEYGFLLIILFVPVKTKNNQFVMLLDMIFNVTYK